jgi:integrase
VKFPKKLRHRGKGRVLARIYKRSDCYRLYWRARVDGKPVSRFKDFPSYSEAKRAGDKQVADLAKGKAVALSPGQESDALAALERLQRFYEATGWRVSLLASVSEYCETAEKVRRRTFGEVAEGFLSSVATVKRVDVAKAAGEFIGERKLKTVAKDGRRPQLSPEHHYNTSIWLREFGNSFPGHVVSELTKDFLNAYMATHSGAAPKTRNERRGVVKMFLRWCVEKDYLAPTHRLLEASGLKHETADPEEIECYTAKELGAMLDRAAKTPEAPKQKDEKPQPDFRELLPVVALAGLAGLRFKEIVRLTWADVFRVPEHIEVKAFKAKTRSRRLIPICPALAQWLETYRSRSGSVWPKGYDMLHEDFAALREDLEIQDRRNGLRHSFISAHFAAHSDENLTAAQAGNSPAIVHKHYKGLLTKKEGEAWFCCGPGAP